MPDFFRFPQIPHLAWLGAGEPRDDKLLSSAGADHLLAENLIVEEKLDGANLGISLDSSGHLQLQNRGEYLHPPYIGQFGRLNTWLEQHGADIQAVLTPNLILFGEWCAAKHSLDYPSLPDWFLLFDVYDRAQRTFWSVKDRNQFAQAARLHCVPVVAQGRFDIGSLKELLTDSQSSYRSGQMEGLVIRRDSEGRSDQRAKLVRADFVQNIEEHWSRQPLEWNRIDWEKNQRHP